MSVKVDIESDGSMQIRFPGRTWELAHSVIAELKAAPPPGYRMVKSQVTPRGAMKSGRRCNVRLNFVQIDDRIPRLATGGAKALFEPYMLQAQGVTK